MSFAKRSLVKIFFSSSRTLVSLKADDDIHVNHDRTRESRVDKTRYFIIRNLCVGNEALTFRIFTSTAFD